MSSAIVYSSDVDDGYEFVIVCPDGDYNVYLVNLEGGLKRLCVSCLDDRFEEYCVDVKFFDDGRYDIVRARSAEGHEFVDRFLNKLSQQTLLALSKTGN